MSKKRRLLYILCTVLLCLLIGYVCFTGCHLTDDAARETSAELSDGGDSP